MPPQRVLSCILLARLGDWCGPMGSKRPLSRWALAETRSVCSLTKDHRTLWLREWSSLGGHLFQRPIPTANTLLLFQSPGFRSPARHGCSDGQPLSPKLKCFLTVKSSWSLLAVSAILTVATK